MDITGQILLRNGNCRIVKRLVEIGRAIRFLIIEHCLHKIIIGVQGQSLRIRYRVFLNLKVMCELIGFTLKVHILQLVEVHVSEFARFYVYVALTCQNRAAVYLVDGVGSRRLEGKGF